MLRTAPMQGIRRLVGWATAVPRNFLLQRMPQEAVCAEIGVYDGDFSAKILETTRPRELHLIDPWQYETESVYQRSRFGGRAPKGQERMDRVYQGVLDRFRQELPSGTVHVHRRSSIGASEEFEDGFFDWIYIDGNHLYEFVKHDLESFYPKVRAGGYITGDDYAMTGWWDAGVKKAVDEFVNTTDCEPILFKRSQFILRKTS